MAGARIGVTKVFGRLRRWSVLARAQQDRRNHGSCGQVISQAEWTGDEFRYEVHWYEDLDQSHNHHGDVSLAKA